MFIKLKFSRMYFMNHLCKVNIVDIEQIVQVSEPNNEAQ